MTIMPGDTSNWYIVGVIIRVIFGDGGHRDWERRTWTEGLVGVEYGWETPS